MPLLIFKDARYFQLAFQSIFLVYGLYFLHWNADAWLYPTYFITCIITQLSGEIMLAKKYGSAPPAIWLSTFKKGLPSALITAFGLALLLKTNSIFIAAASAFIAIASKYIIRINGKHIFNPSAIGIAAAVYVTGNAWISPGQWGSGIVILFAAICLGAIVVTKVQRVDVSIGFLGTYAGLMFTRQVIFLGWPVDFFVQSLSTGSLLLFSFFMITDPKTTPGHRVARVVWSMCVAAISFYLSTFKFINGAPIFVLVCMQPLVPLLDYCISGNHIHITYRSSSERLFKKTLLIISK